MDPAVGGEECDGEFNLTECLVLIVPYASNNLTGLYTCSYVPKLTGTGGFDFEANEQASIS